LDLELLPNRIRFCQAHLIWIPALDVRRRGEHRIPIIPGNKCGEGVQMLSRSTMQRMTGEADWPLLICLLGSFRVCRHGQPIPLHHATKTQALIATLAVAPDYSVARDTLLQSLWPQVASDLAGQSLNSLLHHLPKLLGMPALPKSPVVQTDGYYRLRVDEEIGLDIAWFSALADEGERLARARDSAGADTVFHRGVALYRGDLCIASTIFAVIQREHLRARYLTLLAHLAESCFAAADYAGCRAYAARLLAVDPCREDAYRLIMRSCVRQGERAQALSYYSLCRRLLRQEFDAAPDAATTALYDQIRLSPESV
jgi:DNA-binding SARP family transcriptional activator